MYYLVLEKDLSFDKSELDSILHHSLNDLLRKGCIHKFTDLTKSCSGFLGSGDCNIDLDKSPSLHLQYELQESTIRKTYWIFNSLTRYKDDRKWNSSEFLEGIFLLRYLKLLFRDYPLKGVEIK